MITAESSGSITDPPAEEAVKPKFFSFAWWALLFSAFCIWRYSPKDWAVWNLSSWVTIGQIFCLTTVYNFLKIEAPWVVSGAMAVANFLKAIVVKAVAVAVAVWNVVSP